MQARAEARYIRSSPQKARLVIDLIRGRSANEARIILRQTNKRMAPTMLKVLRFGHRQRRKPQQRRGCGSIDRERSLRQRRAAAEAHPSGAHGPRIPLSAAHVAYRGGGERQSRSSAGQGEENA